MTTRRTIKAVRDLRGGIGGGRLYGGGAVPGGGTGYCGCCRGGLGCILHQLPSRRRLPDEAGPLKGARKTATEPPSRPSLARGSGPDPAAFQSFGGPRRGKDINIRQARIIVECRLLRWGGVGDSFWAF